MEIRAVRKLIGLPNILYIAQKQKLVYVCVATNENIQTGPVTS